MNYHETIEFLYSCLPVFHRVGKAAYKEGLENTIRLDNYFGNPHKAFRCIHVAGTNGKGSVSHMLASVFQEAGYKTGLYTSPHLIDFRERIRVQGQVIPESEVVKFVAFHWEIIEKVHPSFFELTVAMAFDYFERMRVDVAIIEVGLGGRLDSTNIITPELSVITNISWDHTDLLGNSLQKIASEKAGIIKPSVPVVIGEEQEETRQVFIDKAAQNASPLFFAGHMYSCSTSEVSLSGKQKFHLIDRSGHSIFPELDLLGTYQRKNIVTLFASLEILRQNGFDPGSEIVMKALGRVTENTGLMGRWQIINQKPLSICDTGHNEAGILEVTRQLKTLQWNRLHMVYGTVNDKPLEKVLSILPVAALYYFTRADIPRALDPAIIKKEAAAYQLQGSVFPDVISAYKAALAAAHEDDLIFIGGSTFIVADLLQNSGTLRGT